MSLLQIEVGRHTLCNLLKNSPVQHVSQLSYKVNMINIEITWHNNKLNDKMTYHAKACCRARLPTLGRTPTNSPLKPFTCTTPHHYFKCSSWLIFIMKTDFGQQMTEIDYNTQEIHHVQTGRQRNVHLQSTWSAQKLHPYEVDVTLCWDDNLLTITTVATLQCTKF